MSASAEHPWLIAYDIREPRRLQRLHRFLCGEAVPVQYSVFIVRASSAKVGQLAKEIERRIVRQEDDVRIYRIPEPAQIVTLGQGLLPEGVMLLGDAGLPPAEAKPVKGRAGSEQG